LDSSREQNTIDHRHSSIIEIEGERMKNTILIIVSILVAAALVALAIFQWGGNQQIVPTISSSGEGVVYLTPDIAYVYIGVHTEADQVSTALTNNNAQAQDIADALEALGVAKEDIQTSNFSVYPMTEYGPEGEVTRQYFSVDNSVYVKVRALENLGQVLDSVVRSGANTINGITFDVQDKEAAIKLAQADAIEKAKLQAQDLATAAGVSLGKMIGISVYSSNYPTTMYEGKGGGYAMDASNVPVSVGQLTITATANLSYKIK
jgi:uncharacterized protein YggE